MNDSNELAVAQAKFGDVRDMLATREKSIVVTDQQSYALAANFIIEANSYVKDVNAKLDPGINSAKDHLALLKNQKASYVDPVKQLIDAVKAKAEAWRAEEKRKDYAEALRIQEEKARKQREEAERERRAAEAEAAEKRRQAVAQINADLKAGLIGKREAAKRLKEAGAEEEAAKQTAAAVAEEQKNAPPPTVKVQASVPTVAGMRNQTYYYAEVTDANAIIKEFVLAASTNNADRAAFLRQFITIDEAAISKFARDAKDNDKATRLVPGVRFWSRG